MLVVQLTSTMNILINNNKKAFHPQGTKGFSSVVPPKFFQSLTNKVDLRGLEPLTSSMPWMRSSSCATGPCLSVPGEEYLRLKLIIRYNGRSGKYYTFHKYQCTPKEASHLLLTGEFGQMVVALHRPATLCKKSTYYSCSPLHSCSLGLCSILYHNGLRLARHFQVN